MNAMSLPARSFGRASAQLRPEWPDAPLTVDPDTMHPRAVELADSMRDGITTYRGLIGAGFTSAEIAEFHVEARALASARSVRQVSPGSDRLSDMVAKANAAIANRLPLPKGGSETQAAIIAWNRYCAARAAFTLDPWPSQRERCLDLLRGFFRTTPAGEAVTYHVVSEVGQIMRVKH